jgi:hypothetical protein
MRPRQHGVNLRLCSRSLEKGSSRAFTEDFATGVRASQLAIHSLLSAVGKIAVKLDRFKAIVDARGILPVSAWISQGTLNDPTILRLTKWTTTVFNFKKSTDVFLDVEKAFN